MARQMAEPLECRPGLFCWRMDYHRCDKVDELRTSYNQRLHLRAFVAPLFTAGYGER